MEGCYSTTRGQSGFDEIGTYNQDNDWYDY
jgi:hypothetical protein